MNDDITDIDHLPVQAARKGSENEQMVNRAIQRHVPLPLDFKSRRIVRNHMLAELEQGFDHRRATVETILETQLHSLREACNHLLITGKTRLRQQQAEYFAKQLQELEIHMNGLAERFLRDVDQRLSGLERYGSNTIRKLEQRRLEQSVESFIETIGQLMAEFRHILSEKIGTTGRGEASPAAGMEEQI